MDALTAWLQALGLERYAQVFAESEVDLDALRLLSEQDFEKLGVPLGPRKKLLKALAELNGTQAPPATPQAAPNQLRTVRAPAVDAERRQLTVMFCDLVGSTALAERLDPEDLRDLMQAYQRTCSEVIARYEGHVAQYLGDGLMIYFGWPQAHEHDAERAIHAALEIVATVKTVQAPAPLSVRVGIATGAVVVGEGSDSEVGASKLAVGGTPNLAARLQAMAGEDEIIVASSTRRLAGASFDYLDLGEHSLKGIIEPVHAYRVRGISSVEGRFEATRARQLTPLVGRTSEVALLLERWERARGGEGQGVLLSAEPGIGKSRIARALREQLIGEPHISLHYQCSPFHSNTAFFPIIEQFERAARFAFEDTPQERVAKMEALLAKAGGSIRETAPLYAAMLSLPANSYPALSLSPQQIKERTIAAQVNQVVGLAAQQPVIMVLEDAHWADPSTLEFFAALLERIESMHVLLVITYRPEFSAPWLGQSRVTLLRLARLSKKETATLAEQVSGKPLPPEVLGQVLEKTDGVPLFVEELTKALLESGLLQDAGDRYVVSGPLPPLAIPATLHDSLMARLDRLSPVKDLIQLGAVIGREFTHDLIVKLAPMPASHLEAAIQQLVVSELVYRRGTGPDSTYVFKHALVQEAAYESILRSRRQQLHARVATTLEGDVQAAQSDPGFLALHFEQAGLVEKAVKWYVESGQRASLRSANKEALHHFQRALGLLGEAGEDAKLKRRIELHTEIGFIHLMLEGWASKQAAKHFVEAEKLSRTDAHSEQRFRMLVGMITTLTWGGRRAEAKSHTEELIALAQASGERIQRLFAHQLHGQTLMYQGKYPRALVESQLATALYDQSADAQLAFRYGMDPGMVALWWTAYTQWETGLLDQALRSSELGLELGRKIGHPFSLASALGWMADFSYFMWLPERALLYTDEAMEVAQRYGFSQLHAMASFQHGWALAQRRQYDLGIEWMTQALAHYRALGAGAVVVPRLTAQLASVYGQAGRAEEGLRVLQSSPDRLPDGKRVRYAEISRIEGELHLLTKDPDPHLAEQYFQEAINIAVEDQVLSKKLRATTSLAKLWQMQGKIPEARVLLSPLYREFSEGFDMPDMKNAKALLETLSAAS